ncbi:MAG: chemotaxis protein CheW [Myxococcales bacterium]|nr:chemotaxis protein CheW [Myxococcales bacterium]
MTVQEMAYSEEDDFVDFSFNTNLENQLLTFFLGQEEFGFPILQVQEVRRFVEVTPVPNVEKYVRGIINLRGAVVPVIDLRRRLGLPEGNYGNNSVIVVVTLHDRIFGVLVDAVSDVVDVDDGKVEDMPDLCSSDLDCLESVVRAGEKIVIVLNIEELQGTAFQRGEI